MLKCRHKESCNPNCPMYVTNNKFKDLYKVHCVLEVIWEAIEKNEDDISNHNHEYEYASYSTVSELESKAEDLDRNLNKIKRGIK